MFEKEINDKFISSREFIKKVQNTLSVFNQIQIIRKFLGMNQTQLSKRTSISQSNLSTIESGKINISIKLLQKIANALQCDLHIILTPRKRLKKIKDEQASNVASKLAENVFKNIAFEGHVLSDKEKKIKIDQLKSELLKNDSSLWELNA